jgi:hypothetical protein
VEVISDNNKIDSSTMPEELISTKSLNSYQRLQMKHDEIYHHEILVLGIARRMNHVVLHLIKYLAPLSSFPVSAPENRKAFIDTFIMIVSASNLLGISLARNLETSEEDNATEIFINQYVQLLAELAKACEATDHQEDYPIRLTWNKNVQKFFLLLLQEAASRNISIVEEASHRLASVESKHSLDHIFQEKE